MCRCGCRCGTRGVGVHLWVKMWDFGPVFQTRRLLKLISNDKL